MYTNKNEVAIEISRKPERERSLACFCWTIKEQDKAKQRVVRIQSVLCEVVCEQNNRGLNLYCIVNVERAHVGRHFYILYS